GRLLGSHPIRRQVPGRYARGRTAGGGYLARLRVSRRADRVRQPAVAGGGLGRPRRPLRGGPRRSARAGFSPPPPPAPPFFPPPAPGRRFPPARQPGMLPSAIPATSNAIFTVENMFVWNVLPPCAATVAAISFVALVSLPMAGVLFAIGGIVVCVMFRLAAAGRPLEHAFSNPPARRRGEVVDQ